MTAAAPLLALAILTVAPQSNTEPHPGYDPSAPEWEHTHDGPLGAKAEYLEHQLRCNCGCTLDAHMCQYTMQCGVSPAWSKRIMESLEAGQSEDVILAGFVSDFGSTALMTPPMEGFNVVGYLLPFMALMLGGVAVGFLLRRSNPAGDGVTADAGRRKLSDEQWSRLQEEIRELEAEEELF